MRTAKIVSLALLVSTAASADLAITVDGLPPDWANATACFNETQGDGSGNIDLVRTCLTNNNSAGDVGSLYVLFENKSASITEAQFGVTIDRNNDGIINGLDEFWQVNIPSGGNDPQIIYVRDPVTLALKRQYDRSTCGGTATSDGWSAHRNSSDKYVELGIAYGCLGLSYGDDTRLIQAGCNPNLDLTYPAYYDGDGDTLQAAGAPPNVTLFTVTAQPGQNVLTWNNPAQHQGVLVLRAVGAPVSTAPADHATYAVGDAVGNAKVVYLDGVSATSTIATFTDSGLAEPTDSGTATRYYYKVFNHWQNRTFAAGNVPTSSGLFGEPTRSSPPAGWNGPMWCYSTGFSSFVQPVHRAGIAAYGAGNFAAVTANQIYSGLELFRPQRLYGPVQDRYTVTTAAGIAGLFTGDQSGRVYALDPNTGAARWIANGGSPIAGSIQSAPVFQGRAYSGAAFQSTFSTDVMFVASRNASATTNRVFAIRPDTGQILWTGPKDSATGALVNMDIVSGAPWVDYDNVSRNRIWVGARNNGGSQPSLYVLNSLNGTILKTFSLPGVDLPVFRDYTLNQMVVVDNTGVVHGYDLNTLNQVWTVSIGGTPASFPYTVGGGFIITRKRGADAGRVSFYKVSGTTVTEVWGVTVADPSYPVIDFWSAQQLILVGSSDGTIKALNPDTGAIVKSVQVSSQQVGTPGLHRISPAPPDRIDVQTADGRMCAIKYPFN